MFPAQSMVRLGRVGKLAHYSLDLLSHGRGDVDAKCPGSFATMLRSF